MTAELNSTTCKPILSILCVTSLLVGILNITYEHCLIVMITARISSSFFVYNSSLRERPFKFI